MRSLPALALLLAATPALAAPALDFSNAPSDARDIAERLMEAEMGEDIQSEYISTAEVDVDLDGTPEIFAFADWSYFCGSAGCVPRLYARDDDGWHEVEFGLDDFINSAPDMWTLEPEPQDGHLVFVLTETRFSARYVWDGAAYIAAE